MRVVNRFIVANTIRAHAPLSRADLARLTSISPLLSRQLSWGSIREGLVKELSQEPFQVGRPPRCSRLTSNPRRSAKASSRRPPPCVSLNSAQSRPSSAAPSVFARLRANPRVSWEPPERRADAIRRLRHKQLLRDETLAGAGGVVGHRFRRWAGVR